MAEPVLTDAYATAAEYRAQAGKTGTGDDTQILLDLKAVSRYLDALLGWEATGFQKDASDATRVLTIPRTSKDLSILRAPLSATPTTIKIDTDQDGSFADETALASTDYRLYSSDTELFSNNQLRPVQWPATIIRLTPWGTQGYWNRGLDVEIVGKFGWPAVPQQIKSATIELARLWRLESPRATSRVSELEGMVQTSPQAQSLINKLIQAFRVYHLA